MHHFDKHLRKVNTFRIDIYNGTELHFCSFSSQLSYTLTSHNDLLPLDNYLVKPVWDLHKRPWLLLQSLDFAAERAKRDMHKSNRPETLLRLPIREVERYRLQMTRTILMSFTEEFSQIL